VVESDATAIDSGMFGRPIEGRRLAESAYRTELLADNGESRTIVHSSRVAAE
jgi:hypothetical protein